MRKILGCIKRAQNEFNMIEDGDVIGVGVSGGKDSMVLLYALHLYQNFAPVNYTLKAITVNMGFEGFDIESISQFCEKLGIEFIQQDTELGKVIFEDRKESNPCGLCSRMRRGILNKICDGQGITKLALGHHGDDLVETFLMSWIYESRLHTFLPVTEFERASVTQIRPMVYAAEKDVIEAARRHSIPTVHNPCPASGETRRELMKGVVANLEQLSGQPRDNLINALLRNP